MSRTGTQIAYISAHAGAITYLRSCISRATLGEEGCQSSGAGTWIPLTGALAPDHETVHERGASRALAPGHEAAYK